MMIMTREKALKLLHSHAADGDLEACRRLRVEHGIGRLVYEQVVRDGIASKTEKDKNHGKK